jgi:hypothetical protein
MRPRTSWAVCLIWIVLGSAGCAPSASNLPTHNLNGGPNAGINGRLEVEDGCAWIVRVDDESRLLAVWPEGSILSYEGEAAVVRTVDGNLIGREGHEAVYGGGSYDDLAFIDSILVTPIPDECEPQDWWVVTAPEV